VTKTEDSLQNELTEVNLLNLQLTI